MYISLHNESEFRYHAAGILKIYFAIRNTAKLLAIIQKSMKAGDKVIVYSFRSWRNKPDPRNSTETELYPMLISIKLNASVGAF